MKFILKKNIGTRDRWIRFSIGVLLLIYAYWQTSWIALVFSLFTFLESSISWCVLYQILGRSSCPAKRKK